MADVHGRAGASWCSPGGASAGGRFAPPETPLDLRTAVVGGFLTFSAYGLVLVALSRAPLAIVAPLRESAIVLTSLWGVVRLGEATGPPGALDPDRRLGAGARRAPRCSRVAR